MDLPGPSPLGARRPWGPFLVLLGVLAGATALAMLLLYRMGEGTAAPWVPFLTAGVGLVALYWYYRPWARSIQPAEETEPFEDPVIEADRIDSGLLPASPESPGDTSPSPNSIGSNPDQKFPSPDVLPRNGPNLGDRS